MWLRWFDGVNTRSRGGCYFNPQNQILSATHSITVGSGLDLWGWSWGHER